MEMSQGELFIGQRPLRVPDRGIDARQVLQAREAVLAVPRAAQRGKFYAFMPLISDFKRNTDMVIKRLCLSEIHHR